MNATNINARVRTGLGADGPRGTELYAMQASHVSGRWDGQAGEHPHNLPTDQAGAVASHPTHTHTRNTACITGPAGSLNTLLKQTAQAAVRGTNVEISNSRVDC